MTPPDPTAALSKVSLDRRSFLIGAMGVVFSATVGRVFSQKAPVSVNLAKLAKPSTSYISGDTKLTALNDGHSPRDSADADN